MLHHIGASALFAHRYTHRKTAQKLRYPRFGAFELLDVDGYDPEASAAANVYFASVRPNPVDAETLLLLGPALPAQLGRPCLTGGGCTAGSCAGYGSFNSVASTRAPRAPRSTAAPPSALTGTELRTASMPASHFGAPN